MSVYAGLSLVTCHRRGTQKKICSIEKAVMMKEKLVRKQILRNIQMEISFWRRRVRIPTPTTVWQQPLLAAFPRLNV
jgi:hypothetical protein